MMAKIFQRAILQGEASFNSDGPSVMLFRTLKPLTLQEYTFLQTLEKKDYVDFKIYTDNKALCWMVNTIEIAGSAEESFIQIMA